MARPITRDEAGVDREQRLEDEGLVRLGVEVDLELGQPRLDRVESLRNAFELLGDGIELLSTHVEALVEIAAQRAEFLPQRLELTVGHRDLPARYSVSGAASANMRYSAATHPRAMVPGAGRPRSLGRFDPAGDGILNVGNELPPASRHRTCSREGPALSPGNPPPSSAIRGSISTGYRVAMRVDSSM